MQGIKDCPFCGGSDIFTKYNGSRNGRFYYIECTTCGGRTRGVCVPNKELERIDEWDNNAIDTVSMLWNRRVSDAE